MNEKLTLEEIEMYEAGEPLEELRRLTRKTREYRTGVREASFVILDMLRRVRDEETGFEDVMKRVDEMFYRGTAPGYPKPFAQTNYPGE
jgi:hypothetical protein